ncbi:MAG: hypothetical protein M3151_00235 [Actinomycetota bacterium]|nr:hypothetical protein [Actinomycetota bacterium]
MVLDGWLKTRQDRAARQPGLAHRRGSWISGVASSSLFALAFAPYLLTECVFAG